jgi:hypothetical protein
VGALHGVDAVDVDREDSDWPHILSSHPAADRIAADLILHFDILLRLGARWP